MRQKNTHLHFILAVSLNFGLHCAENTGLGDDNEEVIEIEENPNENVNKDYKKAKKSKKFEFAIKKFIEKIKAFFKPSISNRRLELDSFTDRERDDMPVNLSVGFGASIKRERYDSFLFHLKSRSPNALDDLKAVIPGQKNSEWETGLLFAVQVDVVDSILAVFDIIQNRFTKEPSSLSRYYLSDAFSKASYEAQQARAAGEISVDIFQYFVAKKMLNYLKDMEQVAQKTLEHIKAKDFSEKDQKGIERKEFEDRLNDIRADIRSNKRTLAISRKHLQIVNPDVKLDAFLDEIEVYFETVFENMCSNREHYGVDVLNIDAKNSPEYKRAEAKFNLDWRRLPRNMVNFSLEGQAALRIQVSLNNIVNAFRGIGRYITDDDLQIQDAQIQVDRKLKDARFYLAKLLDRIRNTFKSAENSIITANYQEESWRSGQSRYNYVDIQKMRFEALSKKRAAMFESIDAFKYMSNFMQIAGLLTEVSKILAEEIDPKEEAVLSNNFDLMSIAKKTGNFVKRTVKPSIKKLRG